MAGTWKRCVILLLFSAAAALTWTAVRQEREKEIRAVLLERNGAEIKVIAHRGGAALAPENTIAALERAISAGADLAEIDLRMTKDGVLVALHDETLERTAGLDFGVRDLDIRAVRELDAGIWFSPDFEGERLPTLAELLEAARGRIGLMLELKCTRSDAAMLERTVEQIRLSGMESGCVLAASDLELLQKSKKLAPGLETVYIGEETWPELWSLSYVDGYSICLEALTEQAVEQAHAAGREIYVWTVNEDWEMEEALIQGVDGLVTDHPIRALELLGTGRPSGKE